MDKISIVIPVYNAEKTLRKCVESLILGNNKDEIEVILVEDQSIDGSWDVCLELQARYFQVHAIRNERNSGPSYSRNRGIDAATGNLLLFVDADDWVSCDYISNLHEQYINNKTSLVLCGFTFIIEKTGKRKKYIYSDSEEITVLKSADRYFRLFDIILFQQLWNKIFNLQIIKNKGLRFDEKQTIGEDTQFVLDYLRVLNLKQCVIINLPLYYYLRTDQSLMGKYDIIDLKSGEKRLNDLLEISGQNDSTVVAAYKKAIDNNKSSLVYSIMHSRLSRSEKIDIIKRIYPGGKAYNIYKEYNKTIFKEKLYSERLKIKNAVDRLIKF